MIMDHWERFENEEQPKQELYRQLLGIPDHHGGRPLREHSFFANYRKQEGANSKTGRAVAGLQTRVARNAATFHS